MSQQHEAVRDRSSRLPLTLAEAMVGAWALESYTRTDGGAPLGEDAVGLLLATPDGHLAVQVMAPGRPAFAAGDVHGGTPEEESAAARGFLAHAGPFVTDEEGALVRHTVAVALFPNWVGRVQVLACELDGDRLTVSSDPTQGPMPPSRTIWRRVVTADTQS